MSHDLMKNTMAYVGEVPWRGLGREVPMGVGSAEMIEAAGLNWDVRLRPAAGARVVRTREPRGSEQADTTDGRVEVYNRYEVFRPALEDESSEVSFAIVGPRYTPLQNREAFSFFDRLIHAGNAQYETAGALGDGERVWVMAKVRDTVPILGDDEVKPYVLLSHTHNGRSSIRVMPTMVRVVCQNTLSWALEDRKAGVRIRHSSRASERLDEEAARINFAFQEIDRAIELFRRMATIAVTQTMLTSFLEGLWPRTPRQKEQKTHPKNWDEIQSVYETRPDLQVAPALGTLWGLYNAVTYHVDYQNVKNETPDARLERAWFGSGDELKRHAFKRAVDLMETI